MVDEICNFKLDSKPLYFDIAYQLSQIKSPLKSFRSCTKASSVMQPEMNSSSVKLPLPSSSRAANSSLALFPEIERLTLSGALEADIVFSENFLGLVFSPTYVKYYFFT